MDGLAHMGEDEMSLLDDLQRAVLTRDQERGWQRQVVSSLPEVRNPALLAPYAHAFLGAGAVTIRDTRERRVIGRPVSPGEIARTYVKTIMSQGDDMLSKRIPWRRPALQFMDRRPAYWFSGPTPGPFVLVDIAACYATLYSRLTLDVTYRPECNPPMIGLGRGHFPRREEWLSAKSSRNAL